MAACELQGERKVRERERCVLFTPWGSEITETLEDTEKKNSPQVTSSLLILSLLHPNFFFPK